MKILAGDIGGTKTLMQIASLTDEDYEVICEKSYASADHETFSDVVTLFLEEHSTNVNKIGVACFGVAGPVSDSANRQTAKVTNLPWQLDTQQLGTLTQIPRVYLINDFEAVGYGIETLGVNDFFSLRTGAGRLHAPRVVLGAGTGLGVAQLIWQHDHYTVVAAEGGHIDFAPTTPQQIALLQFLLQRFDHVSYERLLSGPGLVNIYEYLRDSGFAAETEALQQATKRTDPAAAIADYAINNHDALASEALDLFIAIYGALAGNLALINLAFGGVYIAGGIAPKIIDRFHSDRFLRAFANKGRMTPLLEVMPVHVVMNPRVGLRGAARAGYYFAAEA